MIDEIPGLAIDNSLRTGSCPDQQGDSQSQGSQCDFQDQGGQNGSEGDSGSEGDF